MNRKIFLQKLGLGFVAAAVAPKVIAEVCSVKDPQINVDTLDGHHGYYYLDKKNEQNLSAFPIQTLSHSDIMMISPVAGTLVFQKNTVGDSPSGLKISDGLIWKPVSKITVG